MGWSLPTSLDLDHVSLLTPTHRTPPLVSSIPLVPPPPDSTTPLGSTIPTVPPSLVQNTYATIVHITLQPMMSIIRLYIAQAVPVNNLPLANKLNHYLNDHDPFVLLSYAMRTPLTDLYTSVRLLYSPVSLHHTL